MTLLGAGVGSIAPVVSWVSGTDAFPSSSLTYSGPSLSTMFDSTGKLTYKPNNLLTYSNTFSNPIWVKSSGGSGSAPVVTPNNATGPDGTANAASTVAFNTGAGTSSSDQSILSYTGGAASVGVSYLGAVYVKGSAGAKIQVRQNGVVAYSLFTLTGGWDWLYTKETSTVTTNAVEIGIRQGVNGTINSSITVQIAYAALSAVTYETAPRQVDQVITTSAAYYGPRIDYDPNTLAVKGLLIEEARTKSLVQSNTLSNASWSRNLVGAPAQNVTGIDGTTSAWTITASGTADTFLYQTGSFVGPYAYSAVFKAGTDSWAYIAANGGGNKRAYVFFDLTNGVVGSTTFRPDGAYAGTLTGSGIIPLGNGFYRCWMAVTGTTDTYVAFGLSDANTSVATTSGRTFIASDLEAEAGAFPTSITRTAAASVTRAADVVQLTGPALSTALGSVASAFVEVGGLPVQSGTIRYLQYGAGSGILLGMSGGSATTVYEQNTAGSAFANAVAGSGSIATTLRAGVSWGSTGGRKLVANGGTVAADASNNELATGTVNLGQGQGTYINGWLRSFAIYNQRLPDATLQAKSVVGASYAANDNANPFAPKFAANDNLPVHWRIAL